MGTTPAPSGFEPRLLDLGRGRTLTVRAAAPGDVDGLALLFEGLDAEARYRRFFGAHRPSRRFLEQLAGGGERGGLELVALAAAPGTDGELVAEAGYVPLPDGDGELAVTVAAPWRGWLGPYLVDAVLEEAARRGVPDLEADVLVANGPMLAVLRRRGAVVMEHPDWSVVRLLVGTGAAPTWPPAGGDAPRVLVEGAVGALQRSEAARDGRVRVLTCRGPRPAGDRSGPACPALEGRPCPLAAGADLVVTAPGDDDARWAALAAAHAVVHPGVPVCVRRPGESTADVVGLLDRCARPAGVPR